MRLEESNLIKPVIKNSQPSREYFQPSRRFANEILNQERVRFEYMYGDWYDIPF